MSDVANLRERIYHLEAGLPPECVTQPVLSGASYVGAVLTCTRGEWHCSPTSVSYAWSNGAIDAPTCIVIESDAGASITCIVSATNANGTVAADPTAAIVIDGAPAAPLAAKTTHSSDKPAHSDKK